VKLQLALDLIDLDAALQIVSAAAPYVDIVEAGTPLIKQHGMAAVRSLRARIPNRLILADMKAADAGDLEVRMAAIAGADLVSVLAVAPDETMAGAIDEARLRGVQIVADLLAVPDVTLRAQWLRSLGVDYILVHCGIDQQRAGQTPIGVVRELASAGYSNLAVAGGINTTNIRQLLDIPGLEIIVVGGAITRASEPGLVAQELRDAIEGRKDHDRGDARDHRQDRGK